MRSGDGVDRGRADRLGGAVEQVEAGTEVRIGARARQGLDPAHARADAPLAGDDEAADLARWRGSACRRTARSCSPGRGPCGRSRRTSRRRTRRRRARSPRPSAGSSTVTGRSSRTIRRTSSSIARFSSSVSARSNGKSKRRYSGATSEPACFARSPTTLRSARWSRCVPVWLRIVCGAPLRVDLGRHRVADGDAAAQRAAMHDQARRPACPPRAACPRPRTRRSPSRRSDAAIADLAAALGVERRRVEHDLRGGARPRCAAPPRPSPRAPGTRCRRAGSRRSCASALVVS